MNTLYLLGKPTWKFKRFVQVLSRFVIAKSLNGSLTFKVYTSGEKKIVGFAFFEGASYP